MYFIIFKVLEELQPHVLFTAHEHKSKVIHFNILNSDNYFVEVTNPKTKNYFHFKLKGDYVYEFMIPTCSYRMGTSNMGYGYAIIGEIFPFVSVRQNKFDYFRTRRYKVYSIVVTYAVSYLNFLWCYIDYSNTLVVTSVIVKVYKFQKEQIAKISIIK